MSQFRMGALLAGGTVVMAAVMLAAASARAQTASPPYTLSTFQSTPPNGATQPDDLAVSANGTRLWVG